MRNESKYKMIKLELSDDRIIEPQNLEKFGDGRTLISKVVFEDTEGNFYSVCPNQDGLSFAMGELTYKEYIKKEKYEDFRGLSFLALLISLTLTIMYILSL